MLRTKLPWLFLTLAVASPPLLYGLFPIPSQTEPDSFGRVLWFILAIILVAVFITLAALTWHPASTGATVFKYAVLVQSGTASLLGGLTALFFGATVSPGDTLGRVVLLTVAVLLLGVSALAFRELFTQAGGIGSDGGYAK